jgi:glucose-fructose oxidoreductase
MKREKRQGKRKVGYAVIGLGHICQSEVLPAFKHARNAKLVAIVSADAEKRHKLSKRYRCDAYGYDDLELCLDRPDVDAVYVCEPNDKHANFAVRCARAGVHVLCEKPLALTEEECRRMIDAAEETGVRLMTAYRLHFEPANLEVVRLIEDGKLGDLRFFSSTFAYQVKAGNIRTSADRGGGALWDLGIYCINAARYLFRADPVEIFAMPMERPDDPRFTEVHEGMSVMMRFEGDRTAQFTVSFGSATQGDYRVVGTKGYATLLNAYEYQGTRELRLVVGEKTKTRKFKPSDQFAPELIAFSRAIIEEAPLEPDGDEGLRDVRIISAALRSARDGRSLTLSWPAPRRRPEPGDRIVRPPVHHPPLVGVEAPM